MSFAKVENIEAYADSPAWQFIRAFGFTILVLGYMKQLIKKRKKYKGDR
nr:hypothetical protein [Bacilli bacterium]